MDPNIRIAQLLDWLADAKAVPFSTSVMVNHDAFADELETLRDELPTELRDAHLVLADRDEVIGQARREAERIVADARAEHERRVTESEIVRSAEREADTMVAAARSEARKLRLEADDYIDAQLAAFEGTLRSTLRTVERGRVRLAARSEDDRDAAGDADAGTSGPQGLFDHERPPGPPSG